jgi:hypothetical protein
MSSHSIKYPAGPPSSPRNDRAPSTGATGHQDSARTPAAAPDRQRGPWRSTPPPMAPTGLEEQTRKLFEVCRRRDVPTITLCQQARRDGRNLPDPPMTIVKSPVSSVMFGHRKFTHGRPGNGCRARSLTMGAKRRVAWQKAWRLTTTTRGKLAADLLQVQRRVTIYSRLGSKSPKGMAVGKEPRSHHIEVPCSGTACQR